MKRNSVVWMAAVGCIAALIAQVALAANVKVTPLGGQDGEFCPQDRALIFEDPNGTNSSTVNIALAKKAKIVTGSEMPPFFAGKLKANGGDPRDSILARFGGSVKIGRDFQEGRQGAGPYSAQRQA